MDFSSLSAPVRGLLLLSLACAGLGVTAAAQLDLPRTPKPAKPGPRAGGPHPPRVLDLPQASGGDEGSQDAPAGEGAVAPSWLDSEGPAAFIRTEVAGLDQPDDSLARSAVASLLGLADEGLAAARAMLLDEHAATLVVGARVMLSAGTPSDLATVRLRLSGSLPPKAARALLDAVLELDPGGATPGFLVGLLDHDQTAVRVAAQRVLKERVDPSWTALLSESLASERSDTRLRALQLAAAAGGPDLSGFLRGALGDTASRVAHRAADLFAILIGPEAGPELLAMWGDPGNSQRVRAYALLAIAEIEDRHGVSVLADGDVGALLAELVDPSPLCASAAAVALAGVGFRSRTPSTSGWLDLDVPHVLVKAISGDTFHADFSSLQGPARRRLELLAGVSWGADGQAWRQWWLGAAPSFQARRAWLETDPTSFSELVVEVRAAGGLNVVRLLGPLAGESPHATAGAADVYFLSPDHARALFARLMELDVFGSSRPPGLRGRTGPGVRSLSVRVRDQEKEFVLGESVAEPWFDAALVAALEARVANAWQRWPDPARHTSPRDLWEQERSWWAEEHTQRERYRRTVGLVLTHLRGLTVDPDDDVMRRAAIAELSRLFASPGIADSADLPHLLAVIRAEPFYSAEVAALTDLALAAARSGSEAGAPVGAELGAMIIDALHERFRVEAGAEMSAVLAACVPSAAREASEHPSSYVRAASVRALGERGAPEDLARVRALLADKSPAVEAASVAVLGRAGVEDARSEILARAHESLPNVRVAALLAAAHLGGDGVLEELYTGLFGQDQGVQAAAAEGLSILAEPSSAPILLDLLGRGRQHPLFDHAREGLRRMGADAHATLLREAQTGVRSERREAALLLAEQGVAEAAAVLIILLTEVPADAALADELAVLTCVDQRDRDDPALAWWDWIDGAPRGDALAWLCDATRPVQPDTPEPAALHGEGTGRGARYLLQVLGSGSPHLRERARRELSRLLGHEVAAVPSGTEARSVALEALAAEVDARYGP